MSDGASGRWGAGSPTARTALKTARLIAGAMTGGLLLVGAVAGTMRPGGGLESLVAPVTLAGLVSPVIGYRLYLLLQSRIPAQADLAARCQAFLRANIAALAVTEAAGLAGVVVHALTADWMPLIGVLTHVLLAGAIWPSPERLEAFVEPATAAREGG